MANKQSFISLKDHKENFENFDQLLHFSRGLFFPLDVTPHFLQMSRFIKYESTNFGVFGRNGGGLCPPTLKVRGSRPLAPLYLRSWYVYVWILTSFQFSLWNLDEFSSTTYSLLASLVRSVLWAIGPIFLSTDRDLLGSSWSLLKQRSNISLVQTEQARSISSLTYGFTEI